MKTLDLKSLSIGVLITMVIVAFVLLTTTGSARAWEYKTIASVGIGLSPEVIKMGGEGWEVVGYTVAKHPNDRGNDYAFYLLKRAKPSQRNWKFWK